HTTERATVLVVEDEGLIRLPIADCFRDSWDVLEAANGDEAKALFVAGNRIDLVFSDVQMTHSLDGLSLAHWIHLNHPKVHVMLTSGVVKLSQVPPEICAQASTFTKPYEFSTVVDRVHAL